MTTENNTGAASDLFASMSGATTKLEKTGTKALERLQVGQPEGRVSVSEEIQNAITYAEEKVAEAADRQVDFEAFKKQVESEMASVDLSGAQEKRKKLKEDFREVTFSLLGEMRELDVFYAEVAGECPEADAEIANAEQRLAKAGQGIASAEGGLSAVQAQKPGFFEFFTKSHSNALSSAQSRISSAKSEIANAEADIEPSKLRAENIRREKIMNADISELLKLFQERSQKVVLLADECLRDLEAQEATVVADREKVMQAKVEAETALTEINTNLEKKETEIRSLRDEIAGTTDPATRSRLEQKLADEEHNLKTLENNRNKAYMYAQSKTRGAEILQQTEDGLRSIHGSIDAYRLMLKSDTESRVTAYEAGVDVMKGLDHLQTIQMTDKVGATTDKRLLDSVAQASIAAKRAVAVGMKDHEGRMEDILVIKQQFAQNDAEVSDDIVSELAEFFEEHGIDGRDYSTLSFRKVGGVEEAALAAAE